MKILFLLPASYPEGPANAKHIQRLAVGLEAAGVSCEVLCFEKNASVTGIWKRDNFGIAYYGLLMSGGRLTRRLMGFTLARKLQAEVENAVLQRGVTHVWVYNPSWLLWRHVIRFCKESHTVVVAHLTEWWKFKFHLWMLYFDQQMFLRHCLPRLNGIVGIASPWVKFAQDRNVPAIQVPVPCPVSAITVSDGGRPLPHMGDTFTLLYSGQLYRRDMPEVMLDAIRAVTRQNCFIKLAVVGKTDVWPEGRAFCLEVARDPHLSNHVVITGFLSDAAYSQYIANADAFVLLHDDSWESRACFPTRLPEYLSTGKPVIVSGVGDIPHYLRAGIDALVLDPGNTMEELVSAILRLASDPEFSAQLGAAGQARALDKFSSTKLGLQLKAFLSPLAQKPLTE